MAKLPPLTTSSAAILAQRTLSSAAPAPSTLSGTGRLCPDDGWDAESVNRLEEILNFQDCEELCRGVPLCRVLARAGELFGGSSGSRATYELSWPVPQLDTFLSHNWSTPRWRKYSALVMHFGFDLASLVCLVALLVGGVLTLKGLLPGIPDKVYGYTCGFLCRLLFIPTWVLVLFVRFEVGAYLSCASGPVVFLDKICIHQSDPAVMELGIKKLGAFIGASKRMAVVYTDTYLRKLWTVYEVASFLALHPVDKMDVIPVHQAMLFLAGLALIYFYVLWLSFLRAVWNFPLLQYISGAFCAYGYMVVTRHYRRLRAEALDRLSTFSVRSCTCAVESDRPLVYSNVALLMRAIGLVGKDSSEDQALDAFDGHVRATLPAAFARSFSNTVYTVRQYFIAGIAISGTNGLDYLSWYGDVPGRELFCWFCLDIVYAVAIWPTMFMVTEVAACRGLRFRGWRGRCVCFFMTLAVLLVHGVVHISFLQLWAASKTQDWSLVVLVLFAAAGWLPAFLLIRLYSRSGGHYAALVAKQRAADAEAPPAPTAVPAPLPPQPQPLPETSASGMEQVYSV